MHEKRGGHSKVAALLLRRTHPWPHQLRDPVFARRVPEVEGFGNEPGRLSRYMYSLAAALEVRSRVRRANVMPKMTESDFKKAPSELLARLCFADRLGAVVHCTLQVAALRKSFTTKRNGV